jgi:hypothetical protein
VIVHLAQAERQGHPYGKFDLRVMQDPRLSLKAKGIVGYLPSKPPTWKICVPEIAHANGCGVDTVRTGLRELVAADYLVEVISRNPDGTIRSREYVLYEVSPSTPELAWRRKPVSTLLQPDFPDEDNPHEDNSPPRQCSQNVNDFLLQFHGSTSQEGYPWIAFII